MPIQVTSSFQGNETVKVFDTPRIAIGRPTETDTPDLDLSADNCVSRHHAVIFLEDHACWIKDLGSKFGTQVNGFEIRHHDKWRLAPEDTVQLGETIVRVKLLPVAEPAHEPKVPLSIEPDKSLPDVNIVQMIDTNRPLALTPSGATSTAEKRVAMLLDLPRQFALQSSQNELLQTVMIRVVEVIPSARRGALLLRDPQHDTLLLKAYVSADEPAVSETLARRALAEKRGFIWRSSQSGDTTRSIREHKILSGMYAPLQWQEQTFGVICVDSPVLIDKFEESDLQFLIAIGQYAGLALAGQKLQADLQDNFKLVERLLANFSPKLRAVLVEQARLGKLRPGGTKSEVTVLFCDICGFTQSAAKMDAHDVVDMLNHYFQPVTEAIFRHDGTVDKFVGDGVLAVFGSPEPDAQQHVKAVRAALDIQQAVEATTKLRRARGDVACQIRVAAHSGEAFHGFVGATDRLEFTVVGDVVNRASRFCSAAGEGEILISPEVFQRVFNVVKAEKITIQTKEGELTAYQVKSLKT